MLLTESGRHILWYDGGRTCLTSWTTRSQFSLQTQISLQLSLEQNVPIVVLDKVQTVRLSSYTRHRRLDSGRLPFSEAKTALIGRHATEECCVLLASCRQPIEG